MTPEEKLKTTAYFIEATSTEQFYLWKENHEDIDINWVQDLSGFSRIIGYLDRKKQRPINVSFSFAEIYGKRICFYEAVSRYVDHTMVEKWIEKNYPDIGMTDAMNFHHATLACQEKR